MKICTSCDEMPARGSNDEYSLAYDTCNACEEEMIGLLKAAQREAMEGFMRKR